MVCCFLRTFSQLHVVERDCHYLFLYSTQNHLIGAVTHENDPNPKYFFNSQFNNQGDYCFTKGPFGTSN